MKTGFRDLLACKYIDVEKINHLNSRAEEIGKLLNYMIENPEKYR